MGSKAVEKELVELFQKAKKAADKASTDGFSEADEQRCVDALKALGAIPVTVSLLISTQLGKHIRTLIKHPQRKISAAASELRDGWKKTVASQAPDYIGNTATKSEEKQSKSDTSDKVSADKADKKPKLELSAESKSIAPPKTVASQAPGYSGNKATKSEEKQTKSVTVKVSDDKAERKRKLDLSAESKSNAPPKIVPSQTPGYSGNKAIKSEEKQTKSLTVNVGADKAEKKPKLELSAQSKSNAPPSTMSSQIPSGNKATKSEEKQTKSVPVKVSADKAEKKPQRELSAQSKSNAPPRTVASQIPGYSGNKATKSEEKQTKSVPVKVSADKAEKKPKLEISAQSKSNAPPKTVASQIPRCSGNKATKSEEKQTKSVAVKVSADKEKEKPELELSAEPKSNAPPKFPSNAKCNDPSRDKFRENLHKAFSNVFNEAKGEDLEKARGFDPVRVAVNVETVMFDKLGPFNGAKKFKYRSIMFNLLDQRNPDLRRRVFIGEIEPQRLIVLTAEEMASDERKHKNKEIKDKALFDCERGINPSATTDQFKCGKCGQRKCTYYQMQTRSADEPMTTYVTCVNCNNHWKFC